jgi:hypothetical protein
VAGVLFAILSRAELEYKMRFYNADLLMIAVIPVLIVFVVLGMSEVNQD